MKINKHTELNLHYDGEDTDYYWIKSTELESQWKKDNNGSYVPHRDKRTYPDAFTLNRSTCELLYCMASIQILEHPDGNIVYVQNGADGLRWLLDQDLDEVPVGIFRDVEIEKAGTGLVLRPLLIGDTVKVPDFDD